MDNSRRYLPSLRSFATFEVAARHLSFTHAGAELNVTQAAVSQQIRGLEKALGVTLFRRLHKALALTDDGERLLASVSAGLDHICDGVAEMRAAQSGASITISGTNAIIALWLDPYVTRMQRLHPEVQLVLLASDENDRLRNFDGVDISIICGNERCEVGEKLYYLFPEVVQPVCSPDYLARVGPIARPEDLLELDLLDLHPMHWTSDAIGWFPLTWNDWFREQGCDTPSRPFKLSSNSYPVLIDAAIKGQGAILGWHHLVRALVAQGALCPVVDAPLGVGRGYYLKVNATSDDNPLVQKMTDILLQDVGAEGGLVPTGGASLAQNG